MLHQQKPERWLCAATAFAMALNVPLSQLVERLGHDGSEKIFPDLREPLCRRGHHRQELIDVSLALGYAATPIEAMPMIAATGRPETHRVFPSDSEVMMRFSSQVQNSRGVIYGASGGNMHEFAYDHGRIHDPDYPAGCDFDFSLHYCERLGFTPICLWRLDRIANERLETPGDQRRSL